VPRRERGNATSRYAWGFSFHGCFGRRAGWHRSCQFEPRRPSGPFLPFGEVAGSSLVPTVGGQDLRLDVHALLLVLCGERDELLAPRTEPATRGRVRGARQVAVQDNVGAPALLLRVGDRDGREQRLGVGVRGAVVDGVG